MNRQTIAEHLAEAEQHVARVKEQIDRQTTLIIEMERDGQSAIQSRKLLSTLRELQARHVGNRDRLRRVFAALQNGHNQFQELAVWLSLFTTTALQYS